MVSVAKPRCARGQNCSHIRDFPDIDKPPKVAYDGALCDRCRYNTNDSEVPEEYKELFRTAKALFDNDVGDEDEIIPTLVLGVDVERDKAWPKSARWLWRRIKEVLPLLVAAGIEANRSRDESAKQITLRKIPTNDGSDGSGGESRTGKGETHANTNPDDGRSNGRGAANGMPNGSEKPPSNAASADTANRSGASWRNDPMRRYGRKGA